MLANPDDYNMIDGIEPIEANTVMTPAFALVAHTIGASSLFTFHDFELGEMSKGRAISPERAVEALRSVCPSSNGGWVSDRLLFSDESKVAWFTPSHKRTYWLRNFGGSKASDFEVQYPTLVFVVNRISSELSVFAVDGTERPNKETQLFHAPVMNVYASGKLCLGAAKLPDDLSGFDEKLIQACEDCLLNSYYTHVNHSNTFKSDTPDAIDNGKHIMNWKRLNKENRAPNASDMVKIPHTLGSLLSASKV